MSKLKIVAAFFAVLITAHFCANVACSATATQVRAVYNKLVSSNDLGKHKKPMKLVFVNMGGEVNAFADLKTNSMVVTTAMTRFLKNDHEIAVLLGHETGHWLRGDMRSTHSHEYAADAIGARLARQAGYDIKKGADPLRRYNERATKTHPDSMLRYQRLLRM